MKKILFLTLMLCLPAISAFAQGKTDFSGNWELNIVESKLDERMRIESMTMKVNQTENDITVGTFTKRAMPTDGSGGAMQGGVTPQALTYSLLEDTSTRTENTSGTMKLKASLESDGTLKLNSVRTFDSQMGKMTVTVNETWELADGGQTLKVKRTYESMHGTHSSEMIFAKKENVGIGFANGEDVLTAIRAKTVSGGVLNGKATKLVKPAYPEAAKAVKAGGAVNVQVTIDEAGSIISATAVSGHPLLRTASEEAALASTFSPTLLQGVPVKVTGIIVYNFTP